MTPPLTRAVQICNGLAAGNIGDELMNRAFWDAIPPDLALEVEVFPNHAIQREPYPAPHVYRALDWEGQPLPEPRGRAGLLVGDTPVTETLGLDWPLRFLAPRLERFHAQGQPVNAVGVGVEPVTSEEGRALFARAFAPIRSWTVRSERCRASLLDLGVAARDIAVGADWAWAYRRRADHAVWAEETWRALGIDPARPLLVVNVLHERWRERDAVRPALAAALDALVMRHGFQVAFLCNEMREGAFFDRAAADDVARAMTAAAPIVPNLYYSPDELLALLSSASVTISSRYHFTVASVLAGTVPITLARSAKMDGLLEDIGETAVGSFDALDADALVAAVLAAHDHRTVRVAAMAGRAHALAERALVNLSLWPALAQARTEDASRVV